MPRAVLDSVNENRRFISVSSNEESEPETRCGIRNFRPDALQKLNNHRVMLLIMCIYVFTQGFVVMGIAKVNVSALERRFHLKSTHMGLIDSAYDFSAAIFGLVISYIGSGHHKARILSVSAVTMMVGTFVMVLPHFTTGLYEWGEHTPKTCHVSNSSSVSTECIVSGLQDYFWVFMIAMAILGLGGASLYTVGTAYIDDSVHASLSPWYLGIYSSCAAAGPCFGYIVGGRFLNLYVDMDKINTRRLTIEIGDARWVGAWWLGPLLALAMFLIPTVGLGCFGAELPSAKAVRESRISQRHKGSSLRLTPTVPRRPHLKQLPIVLRELIKTPPVLFTTLAAISETLYLAGLTTFMAKYIQNVYNKSMGDAGIIGGAVALIAFTGGMTTGGFICLRLKLRVKGMLKLSLCACAISTIGVFFTFARCSRTDIFGIHHAYAGSMNVSLYDTCNAECHCSMEQFELSCDQNGDQFLSPCFAGCTNMTDHKTFHGCRCVRPLTNTNITVLHSGTCKSKCGRFYMFLVLLFMLLFFTMIAEVPADQAALRSVDENHRVIMCGLSRFVARFLGTVPGSIIMGAVTDVGCKIWQKECGKDVSCYYYDEEVISRNFFIVGIVTKICSLIFYYCAIRFYKAPKGIDVDMELKIDDNNHQDVFCDKGTNDVHT